jgi:hypothetical protein
LAAFPPLAVAAAGAAVAVGLANVAKINNVKFAKGGILEGSSHEHGGVQLFGSGGYYGEAEGGEVILTKNVSSSPGLLAQASKINQAAGGKAFASGGILASQNAAYRATRKQGTDIVPVLVVQDVSEIQSRSARVRAMAID